MPSTPSSAVYSSLLLSPTRPRFRCCLRSSPRSSKVDKADSLRAATQHSSRKLGPQLAMATGGAERTHNDEAQVLAFMHEIQRRVHDRRRSPVVRSAADHGTQGRSTSGSSSKVPETRGPRAPMLPLRTTNRRFNGLDVRGRGNSFRGHDPSPLTEKKARGYREQVESSEARNARLAAMRRRCQEIEGELLAFSHNDRCESTGHVATARELSMGHSLSREGEDASCKPVASYDRWVFVCTRMRALCTVCDVGLPSGILSGR